MVHPSSMNPKTNSEELGRYRLMATLGQGGMGTIHLAVAGGLGAFRKLLVLKELRRDLTRNEKFVQMFLAEAKLAARLNHPNVVQTLEAGLESDRYFLAMEFLDGQPLSQLLKAGERPPRFTRAARIQVLCDVLAGLHYAHELCDYDGTALEIVHRDVSPQNVFVTYDGQVKVVDFGIAKAAGEDSLTSPGIFKGKLAYASPEQVRGQPVDRRSDVYSVGIMLWECVAGRRLAPGAPTQAMIDARIAGTEPRLSQVVPGVEPALSEICDRATSADPATRYSTAEEFRSALQTYLLASGEATDATALAQLVRKKFSEERAAMHRLIDANIRENWTDESPESMIRALHPSFGEESGNEDPTTVADLSQLISSSRSEAEDVATKPPPPMPEPRFGGRTVHWALGGVAVVAVFVFFATRDRGTAPVQPEATPAASAPRQPSQPGPAIPATTEPDPTAAPPARATETHTSRTRALHSTPDPSPERERVDPPAPAPKTARAAAPTTETAAQPGETPKATPRETTTPKGSVGDDLRQLKQRAPRTLDTQDPFQ